MGLLGSGEAVSSLLYGPGLQCALQFQSLLKWAVEAQGAVVHACCTGVEKDMTRIQGSSTSKSCGAALSLSAGARTGLWRMLGTVYGLQ